MDPIDATKRLQEFEKALDKLTEGLPALDAVQLLSRANQMTEGALAGCDDANEDW